MRTLEVKNKINEKVYLRNKNEEKRKYKDWYTGSQSYVMIIITGRVHTVCDIFFIFFHAQKAGKKEREKERGREEGERERGEGREPTSFKAPPWVSRELLQLSDPQYREIQKEPHEENHQQWT